jgi:hypothetical protein
VWDDIGKASQGGELLLREEFRLQQADLPEYRRDHFEEERALAEELGARFDLAAKGEKEFRPAVLPDVAADGKAKAAFRREEMLQEKWKNRSLLYRVREGNLSPADLIDSGFNNST